MGVTEQLVRSGGIESVDDLIEDLERALEALAGESNIPVGSGS